MANFEEDEELVKNADKLYEELRPLYEQLHAYVRARLIQAYPGRGLKPGGPIPAHILGTRYSHTHSHWAINNERELQFYISSMSTIHNFFSE